MHLRKIRRKKDGKSHEYWALVESYRTARGSRQRIVAYLGNLDEAARRGIQQAACPQAAQNDPDRQSSCLQDTTAEGQTAPEWVEVNVHAVRTERPRRFGDVWLALELLRRLHLDRFFQQHLKSTRPQIAWADLVTVLIAARFCEPSSELHIAEHFYKNSALADLLGIPANKIYDNRLYRALDHLLPHKEQLQKHLKERLGELFQITYDLILYDVTSTYFEGEAAANPQAQRGHSRDHRSDCKQVCIALVVTKEGIPLGYEVFAGNQHDSKTVCDVITKMETLYGKADRIWIMDRGMISPENLALLHQDNRRYILGMPKSQLKHFAALLEPEGWQTIREGLEVKLCSSSLGHEDEVFILCRSAARAAKEKAIHDRFINRLEAELGKLQKSCNTGRVSSVQLAERRLGRLLERHQRAAAFFAITIRDNNGVAQVTWSRREPQKTWAQISEGCYVLRSNVKNWTAAELWQAYIQLTDAEAAFRIHKDDLVLRPIWHHKETRVQAHILVCFLAYVLWKGFGQMCKQAGLGDEPRKVIAEFKNLQLTDVVLPTRKGVDIRLRCVSQPDPDLALLMHKLKLKPPSRLSPNRNL
jgi:transposase